MVIGERFKNAWSAFKGRDPTEIEKSVEYVPMYPSYSKPDIRHMSFRNGNNISSIIFNKIAVDCSMVNIRHVKLDDQDRYEETIDDSLNQLFSMNANRDQSGREFVRDIVISMMDEGVVALVPIVTDKSPLYTEGFKVYEARVGKIVQWWPDRVKIDVYNDLTGQHRQIILPKTCVPIIENPFYQIMNEPNSKMKRYTTILSQLDQLNGEMSGGKIDLLVQMPYSTSKKAKLEQAEARRTAIEQQLESGAKYGIAYIDSSEKVIQLNRSLENNLWDQSKVLEEEISNSLGVTKNILDNTASEQETLNYNNHTIDPILSAIVEAVEWKWISRTARSQKQAMRYFTDPFRLVPVGQMAELADKMTRNEILSSNEVRSGIGVKPSKDPKADQLINANLNQTADQQQSRFQNQ